MSQMHCISSDVPEIYVCEQQENILSQNTHRIVCCVYLILNKCFTGGTSMPQYRHLNLNWTTYNDFVTHYNCMGPGMAVYPQEPD